MYSLYLRDEINPNEFRTPITPGDAKKLIEKGIQVYIQHSKKRIYPDEEYKEIGAIITKKPWYHYDFSHSLILGLKEPDFLNKTILHTHVYFSHSYQKQVGSEKILSIFKNSSSILYDLEYFTDENNVRLVTFGFWAGVVGCALSILEYSKIINSQDPISNLKPWSSIENLLSELNQINNFKNINIGIIGPNGNCGKGVSFLLDKLNLSYIKYYRNSEKGSLNKLNILINCIKLDTNNNETWLNENTIFTNPIVISDISCDFTKPNNPIKIYNKETTWKNPVFIYKNNIHIISINNLPSLLPRESSDYFSSSLYQILRSYGNDKDKIWEKNFLLFCEKIK